MNLFTIQYPVKNQGIRRVPFVAHGWARRKNSKVLGILVARGTPWVVHSGIVMPNAQDPTTKRWRWGLLFEDMLPGRTHDLFVYDIVTGAGPKSCRGLHRVRHKAPKVKGRERIRGITAITQPADDPSCQNLTFPVCGTHTCPDRTTVRYDMTVDDCGTSNYESGLPMAKNSFSFWATVQEEGNYQLTVTPSDSSGPVIIDEVFVHANIPDPCVRFPCAKDDEAD